MTYVFDLNRFFRSSYPVAVILFIALFWTAAARSGKLSDFRLPRINEPSRRAPAPSAGACAADPPALLGSGACRIENGAMKGVRYE
jgi:hypothetical protein